jgi:hypothetical protein
MPDSRTPGAYWNRKKNWRGIIDAIDTHCEKICAGCFCYRDTCACEDMKEKP